MTSPLKILHLEDDPLDAELVKSILEEESIDCDILSVDTLDDFIAAIDRCKFDFILSDYKLPGFDGLSALKVAINRCPGIPFILVTGNMGEELAIDSLKSGATDYVLKNRISRLAPSVMRALREATERAERRTANTDLKESHEQLRRLAAHLQSVREEERTKVAREIHDELGQGLTGLKMVLSHIKSRLSDTNGNEEIAEQLKDAIGLVSSAAGTVKQLCIALRPPLLDHIGIGAAIEWHCEEFQKRSGIECAVNVASDVLITDIDIATALFRVFQEALTNVLKHSQATEVAASLKAEDDKIVLEIHDNGVGITAEQMSKRNSFGLLGMKERLFHLGGTISFHGKEQEGTTVTVSIPLPGTTPGK